MKGIIRKTERGWTIDGTLPLHPKYFKDGVPEGDQFLLDDLLYKDGEEAEYTKSSYYVEPPDSIHPNRGHDVPCAVLEPDWYRIFAAFERTQSVATDRTHVRFTKYLTENYYPPKRKPQQ